MAQDSTNPRIALGQMNPTVGDFDSNAQKIVDLARRSAGKSDLLVVPLGALTGHPLGDLPLTTSFSRATARALKTLAAQLHEQGLGEHPVILGHHGPASSRGDTGQIAAQVYLLQHGDATKILPTDGVAVCEVSGLNIGVLTQCDLNQQFVTATDLDIVIVLGAVPFEVGGPQHTADSLIDAAHIARRPVIFVNLVGGQDELVFGGGSLAVSHKGQIHDRAPLFAEHLSVIEVDQMGTLSPEEDESAQVYRALTLGLADYVAKNGFKSVVLGMSGGIDSALVAALAADALGGAQVHGIGMPSPYSSQHSRDDASDLARRIGAHYEEIQIGPVMSAFDDAMEMPGVAGENLQARIRGVLLMAASNTHGHLVLAPGNKSELAVGYSTIYGDAVGGYGVIKDLYKTEVWALSRWRNNVAQDRGELPPIPESSLTKPPSAELRPDQVDQDSLPEYDVLDRLLKEHLENRAGRAELIAAGFDPKIIDWTLRAVQISEWKRRQYPLGPKVSARSFDVNRKVPITNRWRDSEELDV